MWWFISKAWWDLMFFVYPGFLGDLVHPLSADCLSNNDRLLLGMLLLPPGPLHLAHTLFSSFILNTRSSSISNNFSSKPWRLFSSCATFGSVCRNTADWEIIKLPNHVTGFTVWCHTTQSGRRLCHSLAGTGMSGWEETIKRQMLRHIPLLHGPLMFITYVCVRTVCLCV